MTDYISLRIDITPCSTEATDLLAAFLADAGYESFVPDEQGLTAYIAAGAFDRGAVDEIIETFPMDIQTRVSEEFVKGRDWNEEWEKNYFRPIVVGGQCVIHSTFHTDVPKADYDIVIDPKMAFGTGHHSTTSLILEYLLSMSIKGKSVIDMGTGTGILAILCLKRGASPVTGIEIDPGAFQNAVENTKLNSAEAVTMILGDATALEKTEPADILIANINRNIILADIEDYAASLKAGGTMILSGFYEKDVPLLLESAEPLGLYEAGRKVRQEWCALMLRKQ